MSINRRNLVHLGLAGASTMALSTNALADSSQSDHTHNTEIRIFDPASEPQRLRKNFYDLTDEELKNFMKAVGFMRNSYRLRDPRQWDNYALEHALHCTESNKAHPQVHWGWHFLPWHRGYLYFLERILANILTTEFGIDGSTFALPYWDWSSQHGMPNTKIREQSGLASPFFGYDPTKEDMTADDGLGFDNSALYDGNRGPSPQKPQMDPANELTPESRQHVAMTRYYMSPEYINLCLAAPWEQFGGQPVIDRNGQGLIEAGPHNCGHDWVGIRFGKNRNMGTLRSAAADPIFFMHHCNIDRIWSLYTQPQPDPTGDWGAPVYHWTDIDGKQVVASAEDIITKFTNIQYAPGGVPLSAPAGLALGNPAFNSRAVGKILNNTAIDIEMPTEFFNINNVLMEIVTGPINYPGKYLIKIYAGDKYVGMLNFLDGEYRAGNRDFVSHSFSVILSNMPTDATSLKLVPPVRGSFEIEIKEIKYTRL